MTALRRAGTRIRRTVAVEDGMSTAEYAVGTVAACGFAGVLYKILTSSQVLDLVTNLISSALHSIF